MGCSLKNRGLVFWGGLKRIVHTKKKSKKGGNRLDRYEKVTMFMQRGT